MSAPNDPTDGLPEDHPFSAHDLMRRLDELNPGDPVTIRHGDDEVVITAEEKKGLKISLR